MFFDCTQILFTQPICARDFICRLYKCEMLKEKKMFRYHQVPSTVFCSWTDSVMDQSVGGVFYLSPSLHLLIASPGLQAIQHRFSFPSSCSSPLIPAIHHLHQFLSTQDMSRPLLLPVLYIFPPLPFITLPPCFYVHAKVSSIFFSLNSRLS